MIGNPFPYLDAKIELEADASVRLHSRGGPTGGRRPRNSDYETALSTIIRRLRNNQVRPPVIKRVLLDSTRVREKPLDDRVLATAEELVGLSNDQVVSLIRKRARHWGQTDGVKGGNSTKALRIETQGRSYASIRSTLKLATWNSQLASAQNDVAVALLSNSDQRRVMPRHVDAAVARLMAGEDASNFVESRDYDVVTMDGSRFAPKKVFGLALEEALEIEAFPGHFKGGWNEPSFQLIEAAGYYIVKKNDRVSGAKEIDEAAARVPSTEEDRSYIEGDRRLASHLRVERRRNSQAAKAKRAQILRKYGKLICERCGDDFMDRFVPAVASGCFEIHHKIPLSALSETRDTRIKDLECLCATCHRAAHRAMSLGLRPD